MLSCQVCTGMRSAMRNPATWFARSENGLKPICHLCEDVFRFGRDSELVITSLVDGYDEYMVQQIIQD